MRIQTYRFGLIEVDDDSLFEFPEGLVGLTRLKRFALIQDPESADLVWLQSAEEAAFALALVSAEKLGSSYRVLVHPNELALLGTKSAEEIAVFVILNRVEERFFVNLKGPIIVDPLARKGKQVVLSDSDYSVRHALEPVVTRDLLAAAV